VEVEPVVAVIIAAGGRGVRLASAVPKQLLVIGGKSLLTRSIEAFAAEPLVTEIVVVVPADVADEARGHVPDCPGVAMTIVAGGGRRQDSVARGFRALSTRAEVVLVHDAARAFVTRPVIARTIDAARRYGAAIAALAARDTIRRARDDAGRPVVAETLPREEIFLAQTPQGFRREVLEAAVALGESGVEATDEAALAERAGFQVHLVEGESRNVKVTTSDDLAVARALVEPRGARDADDVMRVGFGYDSHRLVDGRPLILGGIRIPFERGLAGHSDADVVAHAVTDAILGASALGDIGQLFPDTDATWKDADSLDLLARAARRVRDAGFEIVNVDVAVIAERPKLAPYREGICANLARAMGLAATKVSVKGKTNEGADAVGRGEAIVAHAVALLRAAV
jgi:2-C-methyl-D-erythritol 4-phosphate cytidylyltransferase/2-C-methyl-D-erythritol 2,4-cyclodiphosphate synthase